MPESRLVPLPDEAVAQWAAGRATPLPEAVPGNDADAGIATSDGLALTATRTTNGNGSFRVTVDDLDDRR
jgi:hypothetical protein